MKSLVVYYTRTGNTELVAKTIAKEFNAELRKIKEKSNRRGFFGYMKAGLDALKIKKLDLIEPNYNLSYDIIFVGTPTWAYKPTPAIMTYLKKGDFKNKKVVLFSTFVSGCGNSIKNMENLIKQKKGDVIFTFSVRTISNGKKIIEKTQSYLKKIEKMIKK